MAKERLPDSIISHEERSKQIRAEAAEIEKQFLVDEARRRQELAERNLKIQKDDDAAVIKQVNLLSDFETRDQILDRIREMREEKPAEIVYPKVPLTPRMQAEFDAEQKLGREMVAKAEAELERNRALRAQAEAAERLRSGTMEAVYQNNPGAGEPFPVSKATFGQPRK